MAGDLCLRLLHSVSAVPGALIPSCRKETRREIVQNCHSHWDLVQMMLLLMLMSQAWNTVPLG
eukprot:5167348-Prorocentrum_lima.AAC.1